MDSSTRLPLLHLPSLAIDEVLSTMIPFELINLSKASTTCKLIVKSFSKNRIHKNFRIGVSNLWNPMIRFLNDRDCWYSWEITDEIETAGTMDSWNVRGLHIETAYVYSNGENLMEKWMDVFMDIKQVFDVDLDYCKLDLSKFKELYETIMDWLLANFTSNTLLFLALRDEPAELVEHTLNTFTMVTLLEIDARATENWAYNIPDHIQWLAVDYGRLVELEHLLNFKASIIQILGARLTNEDLNAFLKSWLNMESLQQLEAFHTNLINPDNFDSVLEDIPHQIGHSDRISDRFPEYQQLNGGFDIERKDGTNTSIFLYRFPYFTVMYMEPKWNQHQ